MSAVFLDHLAEYFQAGGLGTVSSSLFKGQLPAEKEGLLLVETGGPASDRLLPSYRMRVSVTARFANPVTARQKCWDVYDLLDGGGSKRGKRLVGGTVWGVSTWGAWVWDPSTFTIVLDSKAIQPPFTLGEDERHMTRYVVNFEFLLSGR